MRKTTTSGIVTAIIIAVIALAVILLIREISVRNRPVAPQRASVPAAGGGAPAANPAGGNAPSGAQARPAGQGNQAGQSSSGQGGSGTRTIASVRVTPVALGTIENSVIINGDILASTQVSLYPTVAGKITETRFQVGDRVSRGTVVAMVDPSRPGEVYSQSPITSTIAGTILQSSVNPGDTVSTQTAVYVVGNLSSLMVETFVPERFSNAARRGLSAQVFLEALPGEIFQAVVDEVSPVLDPASRTLRIRLRFTGPADSRIKAGMFATVSLVTNARQNVPVIPRGAVINTYGSWIVFVVDKENIARRREITPGLENEDSIEAREGLEAGDMVVTAGQNFLTNGEPVRIVE